ncbi:hypothetical protein ASG80_20040 [Agromyces sp. Soil535]|nr:hypothetical protein ASG80_20040 [Agromyces sp. Soil535]
MGTDDDLTEFLRVTDVVRIVTTTRDGRTIATPIWVVDVDGVSFIRSEFGHDSKWFRRATRNPGVGFETPAGRRAVELEAIDETDPLEAAVDDALHAKYGHRRSSLAAMLTPLAHGTTQRVVPLGRPL